MPTECERCGVPVTRTESASRTFCDRCASIASTGARSSSSLLFVVRRHRDRTSLVSLDELRERASARPDERVSLPLLSLTGAPPLTAPRVPRRILWPALSVALAGLLFVASGALAWKARERELATLSARTTPARSARTTDKATGLIAEAAIEPTLDSDATRATEPTPMTEPIIEPATEPLTEPTTESRSIRARAIEPTPTPLRPRIVPSARPAPAPASSPARVAETSDDGELDLDALAGPRPAHPAAPDPSLATLPARADVTHAFAAVSSRVEQCTEPSLAGAVVVARVTFDGDTGRVSHAEITDASVPPEVRSCVALAARGVAVPRFAQERFVVSYPFRL